MTDETSGPDGDVAGDQQQAESILAFWEAARSRARLGTIAVLTGYGVTETIPPEAWSFGDDAAADAMLDAVVDGRRTGLSSARTDYASDDELPAVGDLAILLDAAGAPRALVRTVAVDVVPFAEVGAEFARADLGGETARPTVGGDDSVGDDDSIGGASVGEDAVGGDSVGDEDAVAAWRAAHADLGGDDVLVVCERLEVRFAAGPEPEPAPGS
ncbi:hypothetical protein CLV28_1240 [Sediminihabitans luteus]|uniref:ASCH domain-containing protein n=1 Tax=Sediminihabitans luteus TaxID=1138585 RepID=A0A2M9CPD9_9CELL|nr:ASCH domain-containing protein [Sediminihabitans luteus]PJJ73762.1 hypothetical protein CLV28_1240 [Sediminihabitans luteus]GIJ00531.1 hypothetical protein Slu03_29080 [Sediminihabitans luteus]